MKRISKTTAILCAVLAVMVIGSVVWLLWPQQSAEGDRIAVITVNSEEYKRIDLDKAKDEVFSIEDVTGKHITLEIKDGAIHFLSSDCPDKVCVNTGYLREDNDIAVCLPNQVAITVTVG